jgi:hypothetical protein
LASQNGKGHRAAKADHGGWIRDIRKVRFAKMSSSPSDIEFARKRLKIGGKKHKRHEMSLEALACLVMHPSIIKIAFLNSRTMEGYTLWWNGGSLQRFWDKYNNKLSKALDYDDIIKDTESGLTWEELMMVTTYRRNSLSLWINATNKTPSTTTSRWPMFCSILTHRRQIQCNL